MARLNRFIDRLEAGVVAFGEVVHPEVRLAQRLGDSDLDWVWFGTEHAPPDFSLLADCLQHLISRPRIRLSGQAVTGPAPMIGLPPGAATTSRWMVGLALDCGSMALHQARVQTPEDVLDLVSAARYPQGVHGSGPPGSRGYGPMGAPRYWGCTSIDEYLERADVWPLNPDGELLLLVTIEDDLGLANVEDIVRVPGLGGVIFGSSDAAMAKFGPRRSEVDPAWVAEAEDRVLRAGRDAGIAVGTAPGPSEEAMFGAIERGYTFVINRGSNYLPLDLDDRHVPVPAERRAVRPVPPPAAKEP
jgi:4-hydroxy-2-oxoheptanedioate aldolase